jgi:hypothetical protein
MPGCTHCSAFKAIRDITSGMRWLGHARLRLPASEMLVFPHHKNQEHTGPD